MEKKKIFNIPDFEIITFKHNEDIVCVSTEDVLTPKHDEDTIPLLPL